MQQFLMMMGIKSYIESFMEKRKLFHFLKFKKNYLDNFNLTTLPADLSKGIASLIFNPLIFLPLTSINSSPFCMA